VVRLVAPELVQLRDFFTGALFWAGSDPASPGIFLARMLFRFRAFVLLPCIGDTTLHAVAYSTPVFN